MTAYEMKKLQVEFKQVNSARESQELRIMECEEQIQRLRDSIDASLKREAELTAKMAESKVE